MSAIGLDILEIGTAKWNGNRQAEIELSPMGAPSQFMLPSVDNVSTLMVARYCLSACCFFIYSL